ncbi:tryptophan-rich sensory protein, partial [bacterium]
GYYESLIRPRWAPPAWLFGPVWTVLYGMMAVAAYLVWNEPDDRRRGALTVFWIQLLLNGLWSWIFFAWMKTMWAGVEIIVLWITILITGLLFARIRPLAGWLMLPYLLWVTYAGALNWAIYLKNR